MRDDRLAGWFDDFRARGDAAALERVFDAAAPELLRLASHLAPDLAEAEDLVQMTFVTAIERRDTFDAERELVPWLVGILAGHARNASRRRARRVDPRELAREPGEDPARALEAEELSSELRAALGQLPQLYRDVLARHLVGGERAVDIAKELGRAPGTVRMQIARGLEQLRRALPAGALGAALVLTDGRRGLAAVRASVMQHAGEAGALAGTTATAAVTTAGIGGIAMGAKTALGAAAALLLGLGWWWVERGDALAPEPVEPASAQVSSAPEETERAASQAETDPAEHPAPREALAGSPAQPVTWALPQPASDPTAPGWWLVGEIRGIGRELDAPISIQVQTRDGEREWASGSAAGDGPYAVELTALLDRPALARRELLVSFSHFELEGHYLPLPVDLDAMRSRGDMRKELRADVELLPSAGFRGRVERPDGEPAVDALVSLLFVDDQGDPVDAPAANARTDSAGAFALKTSERGRCVVLATQNGLLPCARERELTAPGFVELGTLRLDAGTAEIRGRVDLPPSARGQRAWVHALRSGGSHDGGRWPVVRREAGRLVSVVQTAWTAEDGTFVLTGLDRGARYAVGIDRLEGPTISIAHGQRKVDAPAEGVVLGAGLGSLTVDVLAQGRPLEGASVSLRTPDLEVGRRTEEDGRVVALVDPRGDYVVAVMKEGYAGAELESPAGSRTSDARITLTLRSRAAELAELGLELGMVPGHGLPDPQVVLRRAGDEQPPYPDAAELAARDGALWMGDLEPGTYEVRVEASSTDAGFGATSCYLPAVLQVELTPGASVRRLVPLELGGVVRVRTEGVSGEGLAARAELLDAEGRPVDVRYVTRHGRGSETVIGSRRGRIMIGLDNTLHPALAPGIYELRAELAGHRCEPLRFSIAAGEVRELTLRFAPE